MALNNFRSKTHHRQTGFANNTLTSVIRMSKDAVVWYIVHKTQFVKLFQEMTAMSHCGGIPE